ncbi:hypothetical protein [Marinoscillum luteum]|uniref:DUF4760 domain-containing protein n=1 Tax=Marinoscillum luteum TaxID=861051 RepID=A0ABW7NDU7_9BACT
MRTAKQILNFLLGLGVLLGLLYLVYKAMIYFGSNLGAIDANVLVAMIAGTVTITGFFVTRYLEKKKLIEQQLREQKLPTYEEFIEFIFKILNGEKLKKPMSDKQLHELFWNLNKKSILWLSDRSLDSYVMWKSAVNNYSTNPNPTKEDGLKILLLLEQLFLDFRKDIGHKNANLTEGKILSLFINDWPLRDNTNQEGS